MQGKHSLEVFWYEDDGAYVARVEQPGPYESLSWLDEDPVEALIGLVNLIEGIENEAMAVERIKTEIHHCEYQDNKLRCKWCEHRNICEYIICRKSSHLKAKYYFDILKLIGSS